MSPEPWGRFPEGLSDWAIWLSRAPFNRVVFGRRVQVLLWPVAWRRRRAYWPHNGAGFKAPIFRYWCLGPVELRVFL